MSERMTLARPYAEAVFDLAQERGKLVDWSAMLRFLAVAMQDEQLAAIVANPRVGAERVTQLIFDLGKKYLDKDGQNFVRLLISNHRLSLMPEIAQLFEQLRAEAERSVDVDIISALALSDAQLKKIGAALKKRLNREVRLNPRIDPKLVGGMIIRAGDFVIDGSVVGRLRALSSYLRH